MSVVVLKADVGFSDVWNKIELRQGGLVFVLLPYIITPYPRPFARHHHQSKLCKQTRSDDIHYLTYPLFSSFLTSYISLMFSRALVA